MIIDLDSHLREQYFLDEIYRLDGPTLNSRPPESATENTSSPTLTTASTPGQEKRWLFSIIAT